jgi:hypothetical protein
MWATDLTEKHAPIFDVSQRLRPCFVPGTKKPLNDGLNYRYNVAVGLPATGLPIQVGSKCRFGGHPWNRIISERSGSFPGVGD